MDEIKRLQAENKRLTENNHLLHEYIEQNRITYLVTENEELKKALRSICSRCLHLEKVQEVLKDN